MITLTINEKEVTLDKPVSVLEAARQAGIKIPTLCYHEALKPFGGCRLCVVEVERMPKLQTACTLMSADGMIVKTESEVISRVRRGILEFLLINHPLDCPYCDKAGECELQDLVNKYGPTVGRYKEEKRKVPESHKDHIFARNMERCVVCTRCVRMCNDVQGASAISMMGRGNHTRMEPFSADSFNCEYCGNCLTVCPVGAILSRLYIHSFRPWQVDSEVKTICSYCGVGCSLVAQVRDDSIKRVIPEMGLGVNKGLLCSRGRFGYEFINSRERLKTPLIRKKGRLEESTWSEALNLVAEKLSEIKKTEGGSAIAGIASPRCSNEDNYIFQKFMRMACGSNNIDSVSRTGFAAAQKYFEELMGQGITANIIEGLKNSEVIFVVGGDPTSVNPILGLSIREASRRGAKIVVLGNAKGLERFKNVQVIPPVFKEADALEELLAGVSGARGVRGEKPDIDRGISALSGKYSGKSDIGGLEELKNALLDSPSTAIVFGMDLVQRADGHRAIFAVAGLTYLLEARLYLLSEKPNEQGLIDAGCVPDMLPGARPLNIHDFKTKFETAWGGAIPDKNGMTLLEIIEGAKNRDIKALYIMGENPVFNLPDGPFVKEALGSLDFLVVQDIFTTETAEFADVVLPALGWSEKAGTYTNLERRIQLQKKAVNALSGMEDWKIITEVSCKMGYKMAYSEAEDIMDEIAEVSPLYRDLSYREIGKGNCLWPYHGEPLRGEIHELPAMAESSSGNYGADFYLALEKPLFHSGTLSRRSPALMKICPEPTLKISSAAAEKLRLQEGDRVQVSTSVGSVEVAVSIDESIKDNKVLLSNNFEGKGVFSLLTYKLDPVTKAPGIEGCEVRIEKL
ncbi:MAG TPA: NADH dehydrogenase (quinone) subunit G [Nitrospirae bacterium]|nr:NADH dehydrogenase (quinone) subunit G [Nitrospirota bacterium]